MATERVGAYSVDDAEFILSVARALVKAGYVTKAGKKSEPKTTMSHGYIYLTPAGGIPARSGTTLGSAECTPYYIDADGDLAELKDNAGASQTHTVWHLASAAVAGSTYIGAVRVSGKFVAFMEDCG